MLLIKNGKFGEGAAKKIAEKILGEPVKYSTIQKGSRVYRTADVCTNPVEIKTVGDSVMLGRLSPSGHFEIDCFEELASRKYLGKGHKITRIKSKYKNAEKVITETRGANGKKQIEVHFEYFDPETKQIKKVSQAAYNADMALAGVKETAQNAYSNTMETLYNMFIG